MGLHSNMTVFNVEQFVLRLCANFPSVVLLSFCVLFGFLWPSEFEPTGPRVLKHCDWMMDRYDPLGPKIWIYAGAGRVRYV